MPVIALFRSAFCAVCLCGFVSDVLADEDGTKSSRANKPSHPNIVLMMADDLGVETLGCYGGKSYRTPHLDRLAAGGLLFRQAYAQPLCSNTRVELMTGRRATRGWTGFGLLSPKAKTFGHDFTAAGYKTSLVGKWQLFSYDPPDYPGAASRRGTGTPPQDAGFDEFVVFHGRHTESKGSRYADPTFTGWDHAHGNRETTYPGAYGPDLIADAAAKFISSHREEPFFLYYPMILPHWPMTPAPGTDAWEDVSRRHEADVRHFPGMVETMDRIVGKIVTALHAAGIAENTLLLFYSDNGTHQHVASLTDEGWVSGGKGLMDDGGTHVPLIAYWPGTITPGQTDALVGPVDFVPTLAELAGIETVDGRDLDGVSFAPVLRDDAESTRQALLIDFEPRPGWDKDRFRHQTFVRDTRWKLYADGRLFDLSQDPRERRPKFAAEDSDEEAAVRSRLAKDFPGE